MSIQTAYEHDAPMTLHRVEVGVGCGDCGEHQDVSRFMDGCDGPPEEPGRYTVELGEDKK